MRPSSMPTNVWRGDFLVLRAPLFRKPHMSQTQAIRKHLLKHNSITPLEALRKFRCMRLAARIRDLKNEGFSVLTVRVRRGEKTYAKYVMG
jgi:hypothetical protein